MPTQKKPSSQPDRLRLLALSLLLCLTGSLIAACTRMASTAPATLPSAGAYTISIVRVRVTQETGMYVQGQTDLPDGKCLITRLLADGENLDWWPGEVCVEVASGEWEILVPLGRRGAPSELDDTVQYEIRAWWSENPQEANTTFPFDVNGPPE